MLRDEKIVSKSYFFYTNKIPCTHNGDRIYITVDHLAVKTEVRAITVSPWKFPAVIVIKIDKEMNT